MLVIQESRVLPGVSFLRLVGKPTDEELEVYLEAESDRAAELRSQKVVVVLELAEVWTSRQRRRMRDWELQLQQKSEGRTLGMALVVPNSLIRGAFTAYFWLAPPDYPTKMVPTAGDAVTWAQERLTEAGLPAPNAAEFKREAIVHWPARQAVPGKGLVPLSESALARLLAK